ncbi:zona pellucida sperm-binding protein 3-like [Chelonia mydas]|uniref:zona pellucida sperm-binding protein 3-like n=1 Tax=Chelonia mydas TaxID=8469 RepID=UPI001CA97836|nr:zona pellucida sperm-binding protein 3-like [Chelonia mydas]
MTPNSRVYSTSLSYNPNPASNPGILRTSPAVLPIECHYPSALEELALQMTGVLRDPSNGFQLGEVMHIQADVSTGNHVALRLFVDSCVATLSPDRDSSPQYAVIDFNGWSPVEGIRGGTSLCSCCETGNCGLLGGQCGRVNQPSGQMAGEALPERCASPSMVTRRGKQRLMLLLDPCSSLMQLKA